MIHRYNPSIFHGPNGPEADAIPRADGPFVKFSDYSSLQAKHDRAIAALRRVANLNEDAGEIGEGMLHRIVSEARQALADEVTDERGERK